MESWILGAYLLVWGFQLISCSDPERSVRLVGGINKYEGRVEVSWNGTWGTICDDQWDRRDAWVICKELGFGSPLQTAIAAHFGSGPGPILLDNLDCTGYESNILNCSHSGIGVHDCTHFEDAGVACSPPVLCLTNPCDHGTCVDSGDSFYCICTPGYQGELCDKEVTCVLPNHAPPGAYFVSPHSSYSYGGGVLVSCKDGPGSTSWTCNQHGQWNSHYIQCASFSVGAYRSSSTQSNTVIGIGSTLLVIGIAVLIFAISLLVWHKKRRRQVESLYEISTLSHLESSQSAYLTMTGGTSPMPSPRRSSSVCTDPLIKAARANMALPPTPTELVRSPRSAPSSISTTSTVPVTSPLSPTSPLSVASPTPLTSSLQVPGADGRRTEADSSSRRQSESEIEREIDKHIAKQEAKKVANLNQTDASMSAKTSTLKQPVAPARPKKQSIKPHFKFPPPPIPTTPVPSKTLRAVTGNMPSANGSAMHNDKSQLISKQKSLEDENSPMPNEHTQISGNYENNSGEYVSLKENLDQTVQSPPYSV